MTKITNIPGTAAAVCAHICDRIYNMAETHHEEWTEVPAKSLGYCTLLCNQKGDGCNIHMFEEGTCFLGKVGLFLEILYPGTISSPEKI